MSKYSTTTVPPWGWISSFARRSCLGRRRGYTKAGLVRDLHELRDRLARSVTFLDELLRDAEEQGDQSVAGVDKPRPR